MLMLANSGHCVFFPADNKKEAIAFRANNPDFKRRRVQDVIQAYEDRIQYGVIYERGCDWPECVKDQWLTFDEVERAY